MADWEAIRTDFETSRLSLQKLAVKHGVSKTYLIEKRDKGQWSRAPTDRPTDRPTADDRPVGALDNVKILRSELPSPVNAVVGANLGLDALIAYLRDHKTDMDLADHVKAATALSQYNRILINADPEEGVDEAELITIDTRDLSEERLVKLKAFALEMKGSEQAG